MKTNIEKASKIEWLIANPNTAKFMTKEGVEDLKREFETLKAVAEASNIFFNMLYGSPSEGSLPAKEQISIIKNMRAALAALESIKDAQ